MNRSTVRELLAPDARVAPGEVLVPTEVGDPVRGPLPSPAAPLVGGTLRRKGTRVSFGPAGSCADPGDRRGGAVLFVATCERRDGSTAALAAAADPVDRVAVAAARSAIEEWSAVTGTRRLLAAASPWCQGAAQALAVVRDALAGRDAAVYVYDELAADPDAIAGLSAQGAVFVGSLDEVPDGAALVFPAHGVPAAVRAAAAARGLEIIDATCPLVAGLHAEARALAERGDDLVLIGQPGHRAVAGIAGQLPPGRTTLVSSPGSTATLRVTDARRVSYLLQPGIPVEDAGPVAAALRSRFPAVRGPHPDGFCYAASDRTESIRVIASACDVMLVVGAADAPDSRHLCGLARDGGARAHVIERAGDIAPAMLNGASALGLAESTSAGPALARQVTEALSGLGPLSVTRRRVVTEVTGGREVFSRA